MNRIRVIVLAFAAAAFVASAADEEAIIAALTGARTLKATGEGYQLVTQGGQWMRAVKTPDGGYSIFSTNGSSRLFHTPLGFSYLGPSNDNRSVTRSARGFTITGSGGGSVTMVKAGSAWITQGSTNNERIIVGADGWSSVSGPLAPMPADTVYELFQQRQLPNEETGFAQPAPASRAQPELLKVRTNLDR